MMTMLETNACHGETWALKYKKLYSSLMKAVWKLFPTFLDSSSEHPVTATVGLKEEATVHRATGESNPVTPTSVNRPEQAQIRDLSTSTNAHLVGPNENASDSLVSKILNSAGLRPKSGKSPVLPARRKTSLEKTTGYGRGVLRRETGETPG